MQEFDDLCTQIQLVKNKLIAQGERPSLQPLNSGNYQYLVEHVLYTGFNKAKLKARLREIYYDMMASQSEDRGEDPDLYEIVEAVDEENMAILLSFYMQLGWREEEIDNVVGHYWHDIGCMLDDWVEEILREEGYFFRGMTLAKIFKQNHDRINSVTNGEGQNILNPEWL